MSLPDKEQYEIDVYNAFSGSDLVIASIVPEEDYIETFCTKCHKIEIFKYNEIGSVRCSSCHKKKMKNRYEKIASRKVELAGFDITFLSYEEDYIEAECKSCDYRTSVRYKTLDRLYCPHCTAQKLCEKYQLEAYFYDDENPEDFYMEEDEVTLLCENCAEHSWKIKITDLYSPPADSNLFRCNLCYARNQIQKFGFVEDYPRGKYDAQKFPIICRKCGNQKHINLESDDLEYQIHALKCTEDCETDGVRENTDNGIIVWCRDELDLFAAFHLPRISRYVDDDFYIPDTSDYELYIGLDTRTNDFCHVFVIFNGNYDLRKSKFLYFTMEAHTFKPNTTLRIEVVRHWPNYYRELERLIHNQFQQRMYSEPGKQYVSLMNAYLGMISSFMIASDEITKSLIEVVELRRKLNEKLAQKGKIKQQDPWFIRYKNRYHCPVCDYPHRSKAQICLVCGYDSLQRTLTNDEITSNQDAAILASLREKYIRMRDRWFREDGI